MKMILKIALGTFIGLTGSSMAVIAIGFSKPVIKLICRKTSEMYKEMFEELT